jgi:hypothetical protein
MHSIEKPSMAKLKALWDQYCSNLKADDATRRKVQERLHVTVADMGSPVDVGLDPEGRWMVYCLVAIRRLYPTFQAD